MKKILVLAAATLLAFSSAALAAGSATLTVTASVTGTCSIVGGTLAFGALDPTTAPAVTANSAGVTVTCTNGTAYTLTDDAAANPLSNGTSTIPFTLAYAGAGVGTGLAAPVAIAGDIAAGSYALATAGAYTSNVTLSVLP